MNILNDYLAVAQGSQGKISFIVIEERMHIDVVLSEEFFRKYSVDESMCQSLLQSYISEYAKSYPMKIGEDFSDGEKTRMVLFLVRSNLFDVTYYTITILKRCFV